VTTLTSGELFQVSFKFSMFDSIATAAIGVAKVGVGGDRMHVSILITMIN